MVTSLSRSSLAVHGWAVVQASLYTLSDSRRKSRE